MLAATRPLNEQNVRRTSRAMEKDLILEEIRRTAASNGGSPLGRKRFYFETGIKESDWLGRFWTSWGEAVQEAGFSPNKKQGAYESSWLLEQLAGLCRKIGHFPTRPELRKFARETNGFPSPNTFSRFGSKGELAAELDRWCSERPEWIDVKGLAAVVAQTSPPIDARQPAATEIEIGFVYLMKSGRFYKIGRSKHPGRRHYELSIQLPEPIKTIHTIETDDPIGIERYWHERFAHRRKNGEWFDLAPEELAAFKRRKSM